MYSTILDNFGLTKFQQVIITRTTENSYYIKL